MLEVNPPNYSAMPLPVEGFKLKDKTIEPGKVIELLSEIITEERIGKINRVIESRTNNFVPVLENIFDRGNINAVMRSAEAFGFYNFNIIEKQNAKHKESNRITKGTHKWLDIRQNHSASMAIGSLKKNGFQVFCTHLEASKNISEIDFTKPTALVFGNEAEGVSEEMLSLCDGNCIIPMKGFAQSFNISVAAAISFYHVYAERVKALGQSGDLNKQEKAWLKANYLIRSFGGMDKFKQLINNKEAIL